MLIKHLTDDEIQQYALDKSVCEMTITAHVDVCSECEAKIAAYRLLLAGIQQQPEPVFDFNLAELVLAQLPSPQHRFLPERSFIYLFALTGVIVAGIIGYFFRGYVASFFTGITPLIIYLMITGVVTALITLSVDMYKSYQKKMNALDFY